MSRKKKAAKAAKEKARLEAEAYRTLKMIAAATWSSASSRRIKAVEEYSNFNDKAKELLKLLLDPKSVFNSDIVRDVVKEHYFRSDVFDLIK